LEQLIVAARLPFGRASVILKDTDDAAGQKPEP
jgi:hypothetical protein